jgi:hypothetical protein
MKTTFGQAKEIVNQIAVSHHDETLPVADMRFNRLDSLEMAGRNVEVLPSAQRLFANRLRIPHSYLERCSADLQAENLNFWLEREKEQRETLFCRFDGSRLRAVFTDRYKVIDNAEIVEKMDEYGFSESAEVHLSLDHSLMALKVPDYLRAFFIGQDKITPGIAISNSEVGILAFSVEAYFYRLVCTNGLISRTEITSKFRHVSYKALEDFHEIIGNVVSESRRTEAKFGITIEKEVPEPLATIGSFNRQFQLTKKEAQAVEESWGVEAGYTMFHVINAYTRGAQNRDLSVEESNRLERVGGQILSLVK